VSAKQLPPLYWLCGHLNPECHCKGVRKWRELPKPPSSAKPKVND
jgi:hypothetical protein